MKEDKEKQFKQAQEELNHKIEAIMGPTPTGEKPTEDVEVPDQYKKPLADKQGSAGDTPPLPKATPEGVSDTPPPKAKPVAPEPQKPQPAEVIEPDEPETDAETNAVVDEIAAVEGDQLLEAEDKELEEAFTNKPKSFGQKIKGFFKSWWDNPKARWGTISGILATLIILGAVPFTRYFILNTLGVRTQASVIVLDNSTQQPLKNVHVKIGETEGVTDSDGKATLQKLKLGSNTIDVERIAFAPVNKTLTLGLGSNPLGDYKLTPVGVQYTFNVHDFLSDKTIAKAEATSGEASAFSDQNGKLVLTLEKTDDQDVNIKITATGYRTEVRNIAAATKDTQDLAMVPARKQVFVSKRSGKYDVYTIDVDGKNEKLVLNGTGSERDDMVLVTNPNTSITALVSTRGNIHNSDGFLMSKLTLIDLDSEKTTTVDTSERIQIIGWSGDRLIYVAETAGTSATNPKRNRLVSYDVAKKSSIELATANYFNDVLLVNDVIYYAPSSAFQNGLDVSLFKVDPDGNNRFPIVDKEVWNIFRVDYDHLAIAAQKDWYNYVIGSQKLTKADEPPANPKTRVYINSPDKQHSLWVDNRDGKGVLISYNVNDQKDTVLKTQSGLKYPVLWVNDSTVIYRINTDQETADYVLNIDGGQPRKITDVTNSGGIDKWYYY